MDNRFNLKTYRTIAIDIADAGKSFKDQDEITDFIWWLLERGYRIFLLSTSQEQDLSQEDFQHPLLTFLITEMPPGMRLCEEYPELLTDTTLWITDDSQMQAWIADRGYSYFHFNKTSRISGRGNRLKHLSELSTLLDPTGYVFDDIVSTIQEQHNSQSQGSLLVGISGPALSGFQQFSVDLRARLQTAGEALVELLDLSSLLANCEDVLTGHDANDPWKTKETGNWFKNNILHPLKAGERVYIEQAPKEITRDFSAHFPLFISEESVILAFAEMLHRPPFTLTLDLSILLEVSPEETARRLYELPPGRKFDAKFTQQYLEREGGVYREYLEVYGAIERADVRVDANHEKAFYFKTTGNPSNKYPI